MSLKVNMIKGKKDMLKTFDGLFSSVWSLSRVWLLQPLESQYARPPCPSPTPGVYSNSCPSSQWCHPAISSSVIPFSSCPQSLLASGSFPMSQCFAWGGQSIGVSALASVLPINTQDWSPLEWTGLYFLQSKGLSRVCSNTTVQKHQFFSTQLSPTLTSIHDHWKNHISLSHKDEWDHGICSNMNGPTDCCTKWHKSQRERQKQCISLICGI